MTDTQSFSPSRDDFAALLDETLQGRDLGEGQVVHGRVVGIEKDILIIDVGLKTEGRIPAREFGIGEGAVIRISATCRSLPLSASRTPGEASSAATRLAAKKP